MLLCTKFCCRNTVRSKSTHHKAFSTFLSFTPYRSFAQSRNFSSEAVWDAVTKVHHQVSPLTPLSAWNRITLWRHQAQLYEAISPGCVGCPVTLHTIFSSTLLSFHFVRTFVSHVQCVPTVRIVQLFPLFLHLLRGGACRVHETFSVNSFPTQWQKSLIKFRHPPL